MPSYLIMSGKAEGQTFSVWSDYFVHAIGYLYRTSTETSFQLIARDSYTLSNLYVRVTINTATNTTTIRSRINGANGNQSVSIPAETTGGFTDAVNTDSLSSGDLFCTQVIGAAAGTSIKFTLFSYILSTASNTTPILACTWLNKPVAAALTTFLAISGSLTENTTESIAQYRFRVSATLSNLRVYIGSNGITAESTLRTRINGGNGNQSVSIGAAATGAFEDTTNTDTIVSGDNVNYQLITGATGTNIALCSIQVKSNSEGRQVAVADLRTATLAFGLTRYLPIEGMAQSFSGTEGDTQATARAYFSAKNMYVNISANDVDNSTTFRIRKNGANGNLVVSVGAGATGQFEDTSNTDDFVASDLLNWSVVTGGTSGDITINIIGFELEQGEAPAPALENKSANMGSKMVAAGLI